jgi:hypothetical protein
MKRRTRNAGHETPDMKRGAQNVTGSFLAELSLAKSMLQGSPAARITGRKDH